MVRTRVDKNMTLSDVPMVREFPNVCSDAFPSVPPKRQAEFRINLINSVAPISKAPYRLAPLEM